MHRLLVACCGALALALVLAATLRAGPPVQDDTLKQALALEKTVQKAIAQAEPSIACILVSRSDLYARFGQSPSADHPGKLGGFDREAIRSNALFAQLSGTDGDKLLKKLDLADPGIVPESSATGIVIDEAGLVLTPYHVVYQAAKIYVCLPGNKGHYADIFAADPRSDLAVLRLLGPKLQLPALKIGDGSKLERGQFVIGLAFPFTPGQANRKPSAAWGVISNLHQRVPLGQNSEGTNKTIHQHGTLVLTDARINLGTSGGALLNLKGEAVALTNTLAGVGGSDANGSLAIPMTPGLLRIIEVLKKGQEVEYGFLGVNFDRPADKTKGVLLTAVTKGSPADQAGLAKDQVVLAVNGEPVGDSNDLLRALSMELAGSKIRIDVRRPGSAVVEKIDVVLAKYLVAGKPLATELGSRPFFRGLRVDYTSLLALQPGFAGEDIPRGVLVCEVVGDSPAATAELKMGQVITHVNDRAVTTPAGFYEIVLHQKGPVQLTLHTFNTGQPAAKVKLP